MVARLARDLGEDFTLIVDSQDVEAVLESIPVDEAETADVSSLLVLPGDGEYLEVWASPDYVVYERSRFTLLFDAAAGSGTCGRSAGFVPGPALVLA